MAKDSNISWTDATWNPWHGCHKISAGCKFCYMYRDKERYGQDPDTVLRSKINFKSPLSWKEPMRIFTCSWSDFFIKEADAWRAEAWKIIKDTPHHTYQILTKRPERILNALPEDWGQGYPNVWVGVSVESQDVLEVRVRELLKVKAKVHFISAEPLLGPLNFEIDFFSSRLVGCLKKNERTQLADLIEWVIIGGESGNETGKYKYRPAELSWFSDIHNQFSKRNIPVFTKQLGTHLAKQLKLKDRHGRDNSEWPEGIEQIN